MKIKDIVIGYYKKRDEMKRLHDAFGIDWTKPYIEIEHKGKFTIHSFEKELADAGFTSKDSILLALVKGYETWDNDEWRIIKVHNGDFNVELPYCLDRFYRKGDFNDARKREDCDAIFFAQKYEHLTECSFYKCSYGGYNRKYAHTDTYERFKDTSGYPNFTFDKSGYCLTQYHDDFMQRVSVYKSEKAKSEYLKTDNSDKISTLERLIEEYKKKLSADILRIKDAEDALDLKEMLGWGGLYDIIRTFNTFREKTLDKSYNSIKESDNDYDTVASKCYKYIG